MLLPRTHVRGTRFQIETHRRTRRRSIPTLMAYPLINIRVYGIRRQDQTYETNRNVCDIHGTQARAGGTKTRFPIDLSQ